MLLTSVVIKNHQVWITSGTELSTHFKEFKLELFFPLQNTFMFANESTFRLLSQKISRDQIFKKYIQFMHT